MIISSNHDTTELFLSIRGRSIFVHLPARDVRFLFEEHIKLKLFAAGEKIERDKDQRNLVIVASGSIALFLTESQKNKVGSVREGRSLELGQFLKRDESSWRYEWVAETEVQILEVDGKALNQVLDRNADIRSYLERITRNPDLQVLSKHLRMAGFSGKAIRSTLVSLVTTDPGQLNLPQFRGSRRLVVVRKGSVEVVAATQDRVQVLTNFTEPDYFSLNPRDSDLRLRPSPSFQCWTLAAEDWQSFVPEAPVDIFMQLANKIVPPEISSDGESKLVSEIEFLADPEDGTTELADFTPPNTTKKRRGKKPILVRQHDEMDCGAACLATVAKYYGRNVGLATFRSLLNVTREGASMYDLMRAARAVGFKALGVALALDNLKKFRLPAIALMEYHFVTVYAVNETTVTVGNPGSTRVYDLPIEEFNRKSSMAYVLLAPTNRLSSYPEQENTYLKYFLVFKGSGESLSLLLTLSLVTFFFGILSPTAMQYLIDTVVGEGKYEQLFICIGALIFLHVTQIANSWVQVYISNHLSSVVNAKFSSLFLKKVYSLPLAYFSVRRVGDFTTRLGELNQIKDSLSINIIHMTMNVMSVAIYASIVCLYSKNFLFVVLSGLPILILLLMGILPKIDVMMARAFEAESKYTSTMIEHFRSFPAMKNLSGEIASRWTWLRHKSDCSRLAIQRFRAMSVVGGAFSLVQGSMNLALLYLGIKYYVEKRMTIGQVVAVTAYGSQLIGPLLALLGEWKNIQQTLFSLGRVDDVFTASSEKIAGRAKPVDSAQAFSGDIEFKNVSFRYGNDTSPWIIRNVSFTIKAGETVALVGRSGSGKTTLAYMVDRLYEPTEGEITVGGHSLQDFPMAEVRSRVGMIMQENSLFSGTILENIAIGDKFPSFEKAIAAANDADAHDFISALPKAYMTQLGENGSGLSGGQMQRINIARTFYSEPPVLIMDEATSALDALSERKIVSRLERSSGERKTIVIAHRLNTIVSADRIIVLDKGAIIEEGSHEELLALRQFYFDLFRKQIAA